MQKIKVNKTSFKVFTEWEDITVKQWIGIRNLKKEEKPLFLTTIKPRQAIVLNPPVMDTIEVLTQHYYTHERLELMPVMFTGRKRIGLYQLPEVVTVNGDDMFLFNETAYTFCQAQDALTAAFSVDLRFLYHFMAYYLRKPYQGVGENEVMRRAKKMQNMKMSILLEVLYHHVQFLSILTDSKHYPNLFGGAKNVNGNQMEGLGFTGYLHEWATEKGCGINEIDERVSDFFMHLSYLRTIRQMK